MKFTTFFTYATAFIHAKRTPIKYPVDFITFDHYLQGQKHVILTGGMNLTIKLVWVDTFP